MSWPLRDRLMAKDPDGKGGLKAWNDSRPPFIEADAIQHAAYVAGIHRLADVHGACVVRRSASRQGCACAAPARASRMETCPHYLTHDINWQGGDVGKINPPVREPADLEALWKGVLDGDIDTVATDHIHRDVRLEGGRHLEGAARLPGYSKHCCRSC